MIEIANTVDGYRLSLAVLVSISLIFYILYRRMRRQQQTQLHTGIEQLKLLRLLLADFQRHRGLSTALLSGDTSLEADLRNTQQRLETSIQQVVTLNTSHDTQWQNLISQWQHIRQSRSTTVAINLSNHHQLILHTTYLIEDIADELDLRDNTLKLDYLHCIWQEVVQTAEWAGQARALGTSIAAEKCSSAAQRVRLRFLHSRIKQLSLKAFTVLEEHQADHLNLQQSRQTVNALLLCLEEELLNCEHPQIEAKRYFEQATMAINDLLGMIDAALKDLQQVTKRT